MPFHGDEDSMKSELRSDCSMCPSLGIHIVFAIAVIRSWFNNKSNVKTAFLKLFKANEIFTNVLLGSLEKDVICGCRLPQPMVSFNQMHN